MMRCNTIARLDRRVSSPNGGWLRRRRWPICCVALRVIASAVAVAASVFLPRCTATAGTQTARNGDGVGVLEIDQAHAEVIERVFGFRMPPGGSTRDVGGAEVSWRTGRGSTARSTGRCGRDWIEHLDQDGPAPDEPDELVNELHLAKSRTVVVVDQRPVECFDL